MCSLQNRLPHLGPKHPGGLGNSGSAVSGSLCLQHPAQATRPALARSERGTRGGPLPSLFMEIKAGFRMELSPGQNNREGMKFLHTGGETANQRDTFICPR